MHTDLHYHKSRQMHEVGKSAPRTHVYFQRIRVRVCVRAANLRRCLPASLRPSLPLSFPGGMPAPRPPPGSIGAIAAESYTVRLIS